MGEGKSGGDLAVESAVVVPRRIIAVTQRGIEDSSRIHQQSAADRFCVDERLERGARTADGPDDVHLAVGFRGKIQCPDVDEHFACPVVDEERGS